MKNFRKPYLSILMGAFFLFFSCDKYDTISNISKNRITYELFNQYKDSPHFKNTINKSIELIKRNQLLKTKKNLDNSDIIMNVVNEELNSNVILPDEVKSLLALNNEQILNKANKERWLSANEIDIVNSFANDIKTEVNFKLSITNLENKILNSDLSQNNFDNMNNFINVVKTIEYQNPDMFKNSFASKSSLEDGPWWRCVLAIISFIATLIGLASCVAVFPCLLAATLFVNASMALADHCLS